MFTHKHSAFDGIDQLYIDKILPQLLPIENQRKGFWKAFIRFAVIFLAVVTLITILIFAKTKSVHLVVFWLLFCAMGFFGVYSFKSRGMRGDVKHILMGELCEFVGFSFIASPIITPDFLEKLQGLNLLQSRVHRSHFEDSIAGRIGDVDVKVCEAKLEEKVKTDKGHHWKTVFQGSLFEMDFHRNFMGTTIVLRDKGFFNSKRKGNMKRIGLASPRFEKIFEAYGTDQVEGRYLLTPTFMETLLALEDGVDGEKIRFAFNDGRLWIAVEHPNRFETQSLRQTITDASRVQTIIDELEAIFTIVTAVATQKKRR